MITYANSPHISYGAPTSRSTAKTPIMQRSSPEAAPAKLQQASRELATPLNAVMRFQSRAKIQNPSHCLLYVELVQAFQTTTPDPWSCPDPTPSTSTPTLSRISSNFCTLRRGTRSRPVRHVVHTLSAHHEHVHRSS